jgi:hypothetical protein
VDEIGAAASGSSGARPDVGEATAHFWNELTVTLDDLGSLVAASRERIEVLMAQVAERDDIIAAQKAKIAMLEAQLLSGAQIIPIADPKPFEARAAAGTGADSGIWRRLKRLEGR